MHTAEHSGRHRNACLSSAGWETRNTYPASRAHLSRLLPSQRAVNRLDAEQTPALRSDEQPPLQPRAQRRGEGARRGIGRGSGVERQETEHGVAVFVD